MFGKLKKRWKGGEGEWQLPETPVQDQNGNPVPVDELVEVVKPPTLLKLDLGCGPNKREGFLGVDIRPFDGKVDRVVDLSERRPGAGGNEATDFIDWPWGDGTVEEVHASHFVEHLKPMERVHFVNEVWRILIPGGKATIIVPHWASCRAYGDMTHQWPPVSEFWFYYLDKEWRAGNAPHNDFYTCDFAVTWGYNMHPALVNRNQEYQQTAFQWWKEAVQDIVATFVKR